jgi:predicted porin
MKKTLVALAALAATSAFAQSSVTISGGFDVGFQQMDAKGNKVTTTAASNGSYTSNVVFAGTEDLGGGLKANFRYEIDPALSETSSKTAGTTATGTTSNVTSSIGNGQSYLELVSNMGTVKLGTPNTATLGANGLGNAGFGTAVGSGYRTASFDAVRFQNTIRFDTPTINGFSASYLTGAKNDKQSASPATGNAVNQQYGRDEVSEIALAYANGPINFNYAELSTKQYASVLAGGIGTQANTASEITGYGVTTAVRGTGGEFKLKTLAASYDIGAHRVAVFQQTVSSDVLKGATAGTAATASAAAVNATAAKDVQYDRKSTGFAGYFMATPTTKLMFNRVTTKTGDETGITGGVDNAKTTTTGLGVDYAMSKRTTAYFRNESIKDLAGIKAITGYTAATGNTTYKATAVGIRHTF